MTPRLMERLARLEQAQQATEADRSPMPPTLYEWVLRAVSEQFGGYPRDAADTLTNGLARGLGYSDQAEADAVAETNRGAFDARMDTVGPHLVERFDTPQHGPEATGNNAAFRFWTGLLDAPRHYSSADKPTADLWYLPNGLPLFDYSAASVRAAFEFIGTTAEAVESTHDERA